MDKNEWDTRCDSALKILAEYSATNDTTVRNAMNRLSWDHKCIVLLMDDILAEAEPEWGIPATLVEWMIIINEHY